MKRTASEAADDSNRRARREREKAISRGLRALDADGAMALLDELCERWRLSEEGPTLTFEEQTIRMFQQFGLDYRDNMLESLDVDKGSYGLRALDDRINDAELEAIGLYHRLHELDLLPETRREPVDEEALENARAAVNPLTLADEPDEPDDDGPDPAKQMSLRRVVKVLEMIYYAKRVVLSAFQAKLAVHALHCGDGTLDLATDLDTRLGSWALRFRYIDKTNALQNLLLYVLDGAMEKRYRKSNGWMYEPIYIGGQSMHAWRAVCEIKDFVYSLLHKETCWEQWCNATASGMKNVSSAIEYLHNCRDFQLPELIKKQGVYSFRNGVYLCETDTFHEFATATAPLSDDVVACKFFDTTFDPCTHLADDWRRIPTPYLQSILDYQGFEPAVSDWAYVLLGRLLYPLNHLDSWQVIPFFKGRASSGKSTIVLKVAKAFYEPMDVGVLSNNIERKFGLSAFYDKKIFVAPEVKGDLACEQAEFQSVVSGEDLQVNVKHKKAFATTWQVPGVLAGNEVPQWADNSGSVQRRIILFDFKRAVLNGDMKLGEKLEREMPLILLKCNRAYLDKVREHAEVNIWTVLPDYFRKTRDQLARAVSSLESFLASDAVVLDHELFCPMEDFRNALKAFEMSNNFRSKQFTSDFFNSAFDKHGLYTETTKKTYRGQSKRREYLFGVDFNDAAQDGQNELG